LQFISDVLNCSGFTKPSHGLCILDRLHSQLVASSAEEEGEESMDLDLPVEEEEKENPVGRPTPLLPFTHPHLARKMSAPPQATLEQLLHRCFEHFRRLYRDGITKMCVSDGEKHGKTPRMPHTPKNFVPLANCPPSEGGN
jgi:hypothetical protein